MRLIRGVATGGVAMLLVGLCGCAVVPYGPRAFAEASTSDQGDIFAYGDSLTEMDYTTALQALLPGDTIVHNLGITGQSSGIIAAREGGVTMTVSAVTIPAAGAVEVVISGSVTPWNTGHPGAVRITGFLAGVEGDITRDTATRAWIFTRATPGDAVEVAGGAVFESSTAWASAEGLLISWTGRNDVVFDLPNPRDGVIASTAAMVDHLAPLRKKFLIISVTTATNETAGTAGYAQVRSINDALRERWPGQFVDLRRLIIDHGLEMAGITPTADDRAAIAGDTVPPSLMSDAIHFNATCRNLVIAPLIYQQLRDRGWVAGSAASTLSALPPDDVAE